MIQITKRPFKRSFTGNPVHYELTSAEAASNPDIFFEIRLMFRHVGLGDFAEVHRLPFYPTAGIAEISVHDLLHSQLDWQMPGFLDDEKQVQLARDQTGEFYIEFREITPTDKNPSFDTSELEFICTAVRGGINYFKWRANNFWVNYYNTKKPFLTWQQSGRLAMINERMYLAWLCNDAAMTACEVRCKVTYMDATTQTVSQAIAAPIKDCIYYVPAGAAQWDLLALDPTRAIHYWEIYIVNLSDPANPVTASELFKYEADHRWSLNDITLHYRNSLGGIDSVVVRGVLDETLDYQFTEQNRTYRPDYFDSHVITAQKLITETTEQQTWKGDIGHLGREEQDRLRDAQLQRDVYMESDRKWWPINITTKNLKLRSTTDMRFTMPIEFTLAYNGAEYYTPRSINLGDGVFTSNVCLARIDAVGIERDFDTPGVCVVKIIGVEQDPQNASEIFRYRILPGGAWAEAAPGALLSGIDVELPLDQNYTLELQSMCGDLPGKKETYPFDTQTGPPPPPPFPISVNQVSNTGNPGSTRTQVFEFTGANVGDLLPANVKLMCGVYSVTIEVVSTGAETLGQMLDQLVAAVNATTAAAWNAGGSAPASGTPGFKPTASHTAGSNRITLVLDWGHQFFADAQWA